jgi:two-component system response regulator
MQQMDILLVEDNEDHVFLVKKAVSEITNGLKYVLRIVKDGEEVLKYLRKEGKYANEPRPDLILLDLKMPKKDGFEVLRELKSNPKYKAIPVVVLTSSSDEEDIMKSYGLGSNGYAVKPIKFEEFTKKTKNISVHWGEVMTLPPKNSRWGKDEWNENTLSRG